MTNWKYTNDDETVVVRTNRDGSSESVLVGILPEGTSVEPADPVPPSLLILTVDALGALLVNKAVITQKELDAVKA